MEQQAPIPQIKDEAARRAKRAIFPSLILGERRGGSLGFPFILSRIKWSSKPLFPQIKDEAARREKRATFPSLIFFWGEGGSRFSTYFVHDCSPLPINNDKPDKKDKSPLVIFKLSFILARHLRKTFLQFTDINHYEAAFNSLNYVPPRKPRLPVMILHRQISDI